jgi:hypothetical protein
VNSRYEENGNLWVSRSSGIWHWKPGLPKVYPLPAPAIHDYQEGLSEGGGRLVFSVDNELRWISEGKIERYPVPAGFPADSRRLLRDRDGGLWIGTLTHGLFHLHQGRVGKFNRTDGLSGDRIHGLFEDREENIWVSTTDGLDMFRDLAIATISTGQGLSNDDAWSVLAAKDDSVWIGTRDF